MNGFDKSLERMTIIVTIIFTIFVIIRIGDLWIGLHILVISPMTGLFVLATYEYCAAEYRRSMEQYRKVLESDRGILERARRRNLKKTYHDFKKRVEKIRSKELREIRWKYIFCVIIVIMWNITEFIIMALFLMDKHKYCVIVKT
ncbi:hypothetical protein Bache_2747 [Bacteroides helcogenes P 36-108]|uniref:Uncharacterized protein n=1 Tax=Bacteroides helcogenes (strain ATCC 35417 / DSM 20613 / JCM 6297 / CCUG 15421 / P 36-108) TaxID=693979 RepID=E6SX03_BACT6|nr:hypothetical protein Bache_2747 [Bacteroides helcogenes P 36-108]